MMRFLRGCSTATAVALQMGLCACITVERPAEDSDDENESTGRDEASAEGADGGDESAARNARRSSETARDGGVESSEMEDDEQAQAGRGGSGGQSAAANAGAGAGDAGANTEAEQHTYCGIMRVTVRVCNGSQDTSYGEDCVDDAVDCLALLPPDERVDHGEYCYTRTEFHVFADEAQPGTCEQFYGYWNDELECLLDSHCGDGERCVDNACECPEGVACVCPNCGPMPARCDGETLIEQIGGGPCDQNRQCVYEERSTDCAAMGLACDETRSACVVPPEPPPMPGSGSGTPGPGTPGPSPSP